MIENFAKTVFSYLLLTGVALITNYYILPTHLENSKNITNIFVIVVLFIGLVIFIRGWRSVTKELEEKRNRYTKTKKE